MTTFTLAQSGRDNNFNLIRFLAALAVIFSHATPVSLGDASVEPLKAATGYTLGDHAVNVFFVLSGFLVTKSLLTRRNLIAYGAARIARLLPGLFVAALVTAFVIGPVVTSYSLSDYFSVPGVWSYTLLISTLVTDPLNILLPGVFANLPEPFMINTPLWTIRYEVMAYGALLLAALAGAFASKRHFAVVFIIAIIGFGAYLLLHPWHPGSTAVDHMVRLGFTFLLGAAAYMLRDHLRLSLVSVVVMLAFTWLLADTALYRGALFVFTAAAVLWFAQTPGGIVRHFNRLGDYSYGLYIYGWPVAQAVFVFNPGLTPMMLFAISAPLALSLAVLSWHFIEKPALAQREVLAGFFVRLVPDIAVFAFLKTRLR